MTSTLKYTISSTLAAALVRSIDPEHDNSKATDTCAGAAPDGRILLPLPKTWCSAIRVAASVNTAAALVVEQTESCLQIALLSLDQIDETAQTAWDRLVAPAWRSVPIIENLVDSEYSEKHGVEPACLSRAWRDADEEKAVKILKGLVGEVEWSAAMNLRRDQKTLRRARRVMESEHNKLQSDRVIGSAMWVCADHLLQHHGSKTPSTLQISEAAQRYRKLFTSITDQRAKLSEGFSELSEGIARILTDLKGLFDDPTEILTQSLRSVMCSSGIVFADGSQARSPRVTAELIAETCRRWYPKPKRLRRMLADGNWPIV